MQGGVRLKGSRPTPIFYNSHPYSRYGNSSSTLERHAFLFPLFESKWLTDLSQCGENLLPFTLHTLNYFIESIRNSGQHVFFSRLVYSFKVKGEEISMDVSQTECWRDRLVERDYWVLALVLPDMMKIT